MLRHTLEFLLYKQNYTFLKLIFYKLNNLVAIVDVNRLGQSDKTWLLHDLKTYKERFLAFGFDTVVIDGHNLSEIIGALAKAKKSKEKPFAILAKTFKGKYFVNDIEDSEVWHGKPLAKESEKVISELEKLIKDPESKWDTTLPTSKATKPMVMNLAVPEMTYKKGDKVTTRRAFGDCLKLLGEKWEYIIGCDGDVKNSTFLEILKKLNLNNLLIAILQSKTWLE